MEQNMATNGADDEMQGHDISGTIEGEDASLTWKFDNYSQTPRITTRESREIKDMIMNKIKSVEQFNWAWQFFSKSRD